MDAVNEFRVNLSIKTNISLHFTPAADNSLCLSFWAQSIQNKINEMKKKTICPREFSFALRSNQIFFFCASHNKRDNYVNNIVYYNVYIGVYFWSFTTFSLFLAKMSGGGILEITQFFFEYILSIRS